MTGTRRLASAVLLAGVGTVGMAGVANATPSDAHGSGHSAPAHQKGLLGGVVGAGGELVGGTVGLLGGVSGAVGSVLGSDAVGDVVDGLV